PPVARVEPKLPVPVAVPVPAAPPKPLVVDAVKERILELAVEKTGYPRDVLDLDLDMEADLGVDTVKQAEIFAAIREIYNIPRDENRKLRDFPTLAHVIRFVYDRRPDLVAQAPAVAKPETKVTAPPPPVAPAPKAAGDAVRERILDLAVEKTGYPRDMLDLDLDMEADLGVDPVKQAEIFAAIREIYSIPRAENRKLRDYPTLAPVIRFAYEKRPDLAGAPSTTTPSSLATPVETVSQAAQVSPTDGRTRDANIEPVAASATVVTEEVKERILALAVEKTGYPREMLDLDLDLEADLGVETVKQAEMFAAIREIYNIPRDENRKLRDYPTLAHVIRFVYEKRPDLAGAGTSTAVSAPTTTAAPEAQVSPTAGRTTNIADAPTLSPKDGIPPVIPDLEKRETWGTPTLDSIKDKVLDIVAEKTGYPKEMLDFDLDLEADLGIDTVKQAEMFASVRAAYNIPRDENMKLRDFPTLAHVIKFAQDRATTAKSDVVTETRPAAPTTPPPELLSFDAANK